MGSLEPFYELVALSFGAKSITTVEYGQRLTDDPRFEIITPAAMRAAHPGRRGPDGDGEGDVRAGSGGVGADLGFSFGVGHM
jgi:hypothetical protein